MNKNIKRIIISILSVSIVLGSFSVFATANENETAKLNKNIKSNIETLFNLENNSEFEKDETVYVMTKADGTVKQIIVTDWLKNSEKAKTIKDLSTLSNIENIKGEETYTLDKDNMKIWNADGNDIYYKGSSDKEVPVDISVSYTLNGEPISAENLIGKSGKATIRFDYDNREYEEKIINGEKTKIYVPYIMLTGTILDNDIFSDIEITNGKIINDGAKTYIIGFSLPGMNENLGISKSEIYIPSFVEISAEVNNFELSNTLTLASNELFGKINLDDDEDIVDEIDNSVDRLDEVMNDLIDGSSRLYDGISALLQKSDELIKGINKLYDGSEKLQSGTKKLKSGADKLYNGSEDLYSGLSKLTANNKQLTDGAKKVFNTLLTTANAQITANNLNLPELTISNYNNVLTESIANLSNEKIKEQVKSTIKQTVEQNRPYIEAQITGEYKTQVIGQIAVNNYGFASYQAYLDALSNGSVDDSVKNGINQAVDTVMESNETKAKIKLLTDETVNSEIEKAFNSNDGQASYNAALQKAKAGRESLKSLQTQLNEYNSFYQGIIEYTNGVQQAKDGSELLKANLYNLKINSNKLNNGAVKIFNGISKMKKGGNKLVGGVKKLQNGSMQLSEGIKQLNDKGIKKITDALGNDINDIYTRIKATVEVSKNYNSFSGIPNGINGNVRFIYKTDEIEK